ncbi:YqjF family protein [Curtobacterium sp. RRHDQ10]|uniref:YqjF family protein n=1 Tax=Curtobacterium phyllosphaerae TaxID=3413379 RepID=UPI003BF1BC40
MSAAPPLPYHPVTQHDWREVVGLHWRIDPALARHLVPPGTRPDEHDGAAWATLSAYRFVDSTVPPLPRLGRFGTMTEIAVQIATVEDEPRGAPEPRHGIAYRSIDTQHAPAVLAARTIGLPYVWARAGSRVRPDDVAHRSARYGGGPGSLVRVTPGTDVVEQDPTTEFLLDRWGVHAPRFGRARWWRRAHEPWPLRSVRVDRLDDTLLSAAGLPGLAEQEPDVTTWSPGVVVRYSRG